MSDYRKEVSTSKLAHSITYNCFSIITNIMVVVLYVYMIANVTIENTWFTPIVLGSAMLSIWLKLAALYTGVMEHNDIISGGKYPCIFKYISEWIVIGSAVFCTIAVFSFVAFLMSFYV